MSEVAKPISWEAVKALAMVVGVREAARRMELSEEQVKKRCTREGWLATPEARIANQRAVAERSGTSAPVPVSPMSPSALIAAEMAQLGSKTRLSLARGIAKAGEAVEQLSGPEILDKANEVKAVTQTAGIVHSWDRSAAQPKIRLELLANKSEVSAIEIEAEAFTPEDLDSF